MKRQTVTGALSYQAKSSKPMQSQSSKEKRSVAGDPQPGPVFDAGRIMHHYHELRELQHQQLAASNLSQQLKRLLFGFPQSCYLPEGLDNRDLLIQNHPLKGRIVMPQEKYQVYRAQKLRERQIVTLEDRQSQKKNFSENDRLADDISSQPLRLSPLVQLSEDHMILHQKSEHF